MVGWKLESRLLEQAYERSAAPAPASCSPFSAPPSGQKPPRRGVPVRPRRRRPESYGAAAPLGQAITWYLIPRGSEASWASVSPPPMWSDPRSTQRSGPRSTVRRWRRTSPACSSPVRPAPRGDPLGRPRLPQFPGQGPPARPRLRRHPLGRADVPRARRARRRLEPDAAIFLLCMARPGLVDERPTWGRRKTNATTISLAPVARRRRRDARTRLAGRGRVRHRRSRGRRG